MQLLLDDSVPRELRRSLPDHAVRTAAEMGWSSFKHGQLLELAAPEFDGFITADNNLPNPQNQHSLPIGVIVLDSRSNELEHLLPLVPRLNEVLRNLQPHTVVWVSL